MPRKLIGKTVFDAAVDRMAEVYSQGHRIVVSFSGGKDSGVCVEVCVIAATMTSRLPVEVIMRDEEIMFPGTFEYAARIAARPEIAFHWIYAQQPVINIFSREAPYWWVFDPELEPEQWVRQPPDIAYHIPDLNIQRMTIPERFPPDEGKELYAVIGLRIQESRQRLYSLYSAKGHITKPNAYGVRNIRPIYDWQDSDIWLAVRDQKWDYNEAYDVMARLGVPRHDLRIAPPTMNAYGARFLGLAARAWPKWFDKVCERLHGVRAIAKYGVRAVQPQRRLDETWEGCFKRVCLMDAPQWIRDRAEVAMNKVIHMHAAHSTVPLPESNPCYHCYGNIGSWKSLATAYYCGDPFSMKFDDMPYVEPEFFRPGAGTWGGSPTF